MSMGIRVSYAGLFLAASILPAAAQTAIRPGPGSSREAAGAANRFASSLFGTLASSRQGNFVASPFSVHSAMSMVAAGAAGETESQMVRTLGLPMEKTARSTALVALRDRMEAAGASGDVTLEVANRVWVQKSYRLLPAFGRGVELVFAAGFAEADFADRAETTRQEINGWVESRTRNRIRNLVPAGLLSPATRMVLVNAVYFHGAWQTPFPEDRTEAAPFLVAPGRSVRADLMQAHLDRIGYREEPGLQVCELPYRGRNLSMVVLLPAAGKLGELEARIATEGFDAVCGAVAPQTVDVALPRFKIEAQFGLNDPLAALGMRDAFDPGKADFSGMTGTRDLFVSVVLHKAFIEVNEKGTEAAAATAAVLGLSAAMPSKPVEFRANRPFLFALRDRPSGAVLFLGRVARPGE